jgi:hypothetical protein
VVDVAQRIQNGRNLLDAGNEKAANRELTDAVVECRDPRQAAEIRQLADRGLEMAGRLGKARWRELARLADLRITPTVKS